MDKNAILDAIKEAQANVELCRKGLGQRGSEISNATLQHHFTVDLAYRNGLVHALLLSGECNDSDIDYLRTLPNKPMIWSEMLKENTP